MNQHWAIWRETEMTTMSTRKDNSVAFLKGTQCPPCFTYCLCAVAVIKWQTGAAAALK